ncbi:MAG: hypothetical protein PF484_08275 [Bacteroidales bacterium]|jgi:hypothetical protein|nr:hypothetical protein [Bacteroidales bacterium]
MLDLGQIQVKVPKHFSIPNMVLLAGAGQNVGKTSFAVAIIKQLKKQGNVVYALKITPHFHDTETENIIIQTADYQIYLEKDRNGNKDTSRMLGAGADEVFFVQTKSDIVLPDAFDFVHRMARKNVLWVCESGGLRFFVNPGLFLYFKWKGKEIEKNSAKKLMPLADRIVEFNDGHFDFSPEYISVKDYQFKILK